LWSTVQIKAILDQEILDSAQEKSTCENVQDSPPRFKRQFPTSVSSPHRSPQRKKVLSSRKSLAKQYEDSQSDHVLSELNVDELVDKPTTQVKVVIVNPNNRVETRMSFTDDSKTLILNICRGKWSTVANVVFKHHLLRKQLLQPLRKTVAEEFKAYCRDDEQSILKDINPLQISKFSNQMLVNEVELRCPFWISCLMGACKARNTSCESTENKVINSIALSTAVAARSRNQKMSALAYRTSTILFHSGARSEDIERLSKLGICMSPDMTVDFQRKMGENCRTKVLQWKSEIEKAKLAVLLLKDVREKLALAEEIQFTESKIKEYEYYTPEVFTYCKDVLNTSDGFLKNEDIETAINQISRTKLPSYK